MPAFLLNYGGPPPFIWDSSNFLTEARFNLNVATTLEACVKQYGGTPQATAFSVNNITVTYYEIGIHRMLKVELPEGADRVSQEKYAEALIAAQELRGNKYRLLQHNCVTATATVLNTLDPKILQGKYILPRTLDNSIAELTREHSRVQKVLEPKAQAKKIHNISTVNLTNTKTEFTGALWKAMGPENQQIQMKQTIKNIRQEEKESKFDWLRNIFKCG